MRETTIYSYDVEVPVGSIICDECCRISKSSDLCESVCQSCLDYNLNKEEDF